jgi:DNA-3-methyladenine glycosylase I
MVADKKRCAWVANDPLAIKYHDEEYGVPLEDDDELFERLSLEIFQAGLNWRMVLHKRPAFRKAFAEFSINRVASFGEEDVLRLMDNKDIIRNKLKIKATIENAKRLKAVISEYGSFASYISDLGDDKEAMYKAFKKRFAFMGPQIAESFFQSVGKLDEMHDAGCWKARRGRHKHPH